MPSKTSRMKAQYEQEYYANRQAEVLRCQNSLLPGQKMLTCSLCQKVCKVQQCQTKICSLVNNMGKCTHPGEIPY